MNCDYVVIDGGNIAAALSGSDQSTTNWFDSDETVMPDDNVPRNAALCSVKEEVKLPDGMLLGIMALAEVLPLLATRV
jgi:hypothetical protein